MPAAREVAYGALADVFINPERELYKDSDGDLFRSEEARNV
jgi:hemoglobin-like flavoprotein